MRPDLTWITGDAVYADAPWWLYTTMARATPRSYLLLEYWTAWGMQVRDCPAPPKTAEHTEECPDCGGTGKVRRAGMRELLTAGPNWFLPDDHEFWNNWPHISATTRHSWPNLVRSWLGGRRRRRPGADLGEDREPTRWTRALRENYLPVHPDEWGKWSRGSFDLFGSFQTRPDGRDAGVSLGEREHPAPRRARWPRRASDLRPPTVNRLVQRIDLGVVQVALLDTRTRRTRRTGHARYSQFVDDSALEQMLKIAEKAPVFVLVLAQPVLRPSRRTEHGEQLKSTDYGIEHYGHQYERFWRGLAAARDGRPTITIGGDIHQSYVGWAPELALLEVVASPMSLVEGGALGQVWDAVDVFRMQRTTRASGSEEQVAADPSYRRDTQIVDLASLVKGGPREEPWGVTGRAVTVAGLPPHSESFATLTFTRDTEAEVRLDVRLYLRDELADEVTESARLVTWRMNAQGKQDPRQGPVAG